MKHGKRKWVRFRHKVYVTIAKTILRGYVKKKYNVKLKPFNNPDKRQYLIMYNHQTAFDQFFIALSFKGSVYYVASEDLFSNGFISSLLKHAVAPIPIKKQTTDPRAVMDCARVVKEGGTIAVAPEGNRTFSGKTENINPSIAKMARLLKLPIAFFKIEGGYGVHPRWSDKVRKGNMRAYVSRILEPEEFLPLSDEELFSLIKKELFVDETTSTAEFYSKNSAEYLDRVLYVCPHCGLTNIYSNGNTVKCVKCGKTAVYSPDKTFSGDFGFKHVNDWYEYQQDFVNKLNISDYYKKPAFTDKAKISKVILYKKKRVLFNNADIALYGDKIVVNNSGKNGMIFPFSRVSGASVLGKNKLNIYFDGKVYQFKGDKRFNAVKYVNFYYKYNNELKGEKNGKFLGL